MNKITLWRNILQSKYFGENSPYAKHRAKIVSLNRKLSKSQDGETTVSLKAELSNLYGMEALKPSLGKDVNLTLYKAELEKKRLELAEHCEETPVPENRRIFKQGEGISLRNS